MRAFTKHNLVKQGVYLTLKTEEPFPARNKFVARFKHRGVVSMAAFKKELINSFTIERYFQEYDNGKAPLNILMENNPEWYKREVDKYLNKNR